MSAVNSLNRILQGFEPSKGKTRVMKEGLFLLLVFYILLSFRALSYVATSLGRPFISGGSTNPTSMWRMYSNTPMHPREPNFPYRTVDSSRTSSVAISPSVTAPPGMSSGCHHHMAPVPATPHGSPYCYSICSTSVISTSRWSSVYWNFFSSRPRTNKLWLNLHQRLCRLLKWISTSWKKDWWKL